MIPSNPHATGRTRNRLFAALILVPIVAFYWMLARETINIPFLDDYSGILGFMAAWIRLETVQQKAMSILTSQHNEYKLILPNTVYVLQYLTIRHINFAVLATIGNLLVLPLLFVIYRMWTDRAAPDDRLLLFVPVSWMLFQLQYYSLLNWPGTSLQNISVVLFSLLTIYLLSRKDPWAFHAATASLVFGVASSGNGFFVVPVGLAMLLQLGQAKRLVYWLGMSACLFGVYLYRYNFLSSQSRPDHSVVSSLSHVSPLYALSFLGASIARYGDYLPAAILGTCLCAIFAYSLVDRFYLRNPAMFYSTCFIMITAVAVSGLRSDLGIAQSLVSRYRIYSNLLLIFVYLYVMEEMMRRRSARPGGRRRIQSTAAAAIFVAIGFNIGSNYAGFKLLRIRTEMTRQGLYRWEHGQDPNAAAAEPANEDPVIRRQRLNGNYTPEDEYLRQAMILRIYSPPYLTAPN